jgi:hypothetical protein
MVKRPRGRRRKVEGSMKPREFGRLAKVSSAYDELRENGEKHSSAVTGVVAHLRQSSPEMPISETGVKRILSKFRPKEGGAILRFERFPMTEEDINRYRAVFEQAAAALENMGLRLPQMPVYDKTRRRDKFLIRFSERPKYPRHNGKPQ